MEATVVWDAFSAVHPVTARSKVTTRNKQSGARGTIGWTVRKTNTGTGAIRVWVNNQDQVTYDREVEATAGADKAAKEAAKTSGWQIMESQASVPITATDPEEKTIEVKDGAFVRYRLEFVSTAGTSVLTSRVSSA